GLDQYSMWLADNNGNMLSNPSGVVGGSEIGRASCRARVQQDLNAGGREGTMTTTIESFGANRLVEMGNQYQLLDSGNSGPGVKFQGHAVTDGQFGGWTLIGAEKTASGYELAWKIAGLDQYSVWLADANGNMLSNPSGVVGGS